MIGSRTVPRTLRLTSVFHPTDFSLPSEIAFVHALKLALAARAELRILHINERKAPARWTEFPQVRATLARWGLLPKGSPKAAVSRLGLRVEKVRAAPGDPTASVLRYLEAWPADLIVLATHQRDGLARWLYHAVAEPIARRAGVMTLFVPPGTNGFVSLTEGTVRLQQVLIPVDRAPRPQAAVAAAAALTHTLSRKAVSFTLLHVGPEEEMPRLHLPEQEGWTWNMTTRRGEAVDQVLSVRDECSADVIVMATQGHKGFLDALRGSTTERVLRGAQCPVLTIPADY